MSWSMTSVSYRMAGSGSWHNLLPDEPSRRLYADIYPLGVSLPTADDPCYDLLHSWQKGRIIRTEKQKAIPTGPIMTDEDLKVLNPWFQDISDAMCKAVWEHLPEYHSLASNISGGNAFTSQRFENILTIHICAHTLDSWVFSLIRRELIGTYPPRDFAGTFFFWGYGFSSGPKRIFGFTTYGGQHMMRLHVLRSHGLNREKVKTLLQRSDLMNYLFHIYIQSRTSTGSPATVYPHVEGTKDIDYMIDVLKEVKILESEHPSRLAIPVFTERHMAPAVDLFQTVSGKILDRMIDKMDELKTLVRSCSFSQCTWSDVFCMLFHLAYSYAADKLVEKGTIPDFPQSADGEWGIWIH